MRKTLAIVLMAVALSLTAPGQGRADIITFDEPVIAGVLNNAPNSFSLTTPLSELYAPLGVHFAGPNSIFGLPNGGAILNDTSGFGVSAHSGSNFLAFNRNANFPGIDIVEFPFGTFHIPGGTASDPEAITFDDPQSSVSIWAAGGNKSHLFELEAFDGSNTLLGSDTVNTKGWSQLTVSGADIQYVTLTEIGNWGDSFVYDDLSFTPAASVDGGPERAPEPASLVLVGLGGVGLAGWRWRSGKRVINI